MIGFIILFLPAVFALGLYETLTKKSLNVKNAIIRYCNYALFINFGCFAIKKYFLRTDTEFMFQGGDMLPLVAFNYVVMAVGVAVVLVAAEILLSKNIKINVEEETSEEASKN